MSRIKYARRRGNREAKNQAEAAPCPALLSPLPDIKPAESKAQPSTTNSEPSPKERSLSVVVSYEEILPCHLGPDGSVSASEVAAGI